VRLYNGVSDGDRIYMWCDIPVVGIEDETVDQCFDLLFHADSAHLDSQIAP
jgi:hypothetical protein